MTHDKAKKVVEPYSCPLQVGTFGCACENCYKKIMEQLTTLLTEE